MQRNATAPTRCTPSPLFPLPRGERETSIATLSQCVALVERSEPQRLFSLSHLWERVPEGQERGRNETH